MNKLTDKSILIIDDDYNLQEMLTELLYANGYTNINSTYTIQQSQEYLSNNTPSLIILDVGLPDGSGYDLARSIKTKMDVPIIFLTARSDEHDEYYSFISGGDDFLSKPFSPIVLIARINNLLNRYYKNIQQVITIQDLTIDFSKNTAYKNGSTISFTQTEYKLLQKLAVNINCIVQTEELGRHIWGSNAFGFENSLMVHVRNIREKIENNPSKPEILVTVKGLGYKLVS